MMFKGVAIVVYLGTFFFVIYLLRDFHALLNRLQAVRRAQDNGDIKMRELPAPFVSGVIKIIASCWAFLFNSTGPLIYSMFGLDVTTLITKNPAVTPVYLSMFSQALMAAIGAWGLMDMAEGMRLVWVPPTDVLAKRLKGSGRGRIPETVAQNLREAGEKGKGNGDDTANVRQQTKERQLPS